MSPARTKTQTAYLGIDPGLKGGFAFYEPYVEAEYMLTSWPMPEDLNGIWDILFGMCEISKRNNYELTICLEMVHAMPKQGVRSMFTFGFGYGAVCMAVVWATKQYPKIVVEVLRPSPQEWQGFLGINKRSKELEMRKLKSGKNKGKVKEVQKESSNDHKKKLYSFAQKLMPAARFGLQVADAVLLAYYARRLQEPYEPPKEVKPKAVKIGRSLIANR